MVEEVRIAVAHSNVNRILGDLSALLIEVNSRSTMNTIMVSPQGSCLIRIAFSEHAQCASFTEKLSLRCIRHTVLEIY